VVPNPEIGFRPLSIHKSNEDENSFVIGTAVINTQTEWGGRRNGCRRRRGILFYSYSMIL
jgi:hypothetical protein